MTRTTIDTTTMATTMATTTRIAIVTATLVALGGGTGVVCAGPPQERESLERRSQAAAIEAALRDQGVGADQLGHRGHLAAGLVAAWNELAHDIAVAEDQLLTFKGQRTMAIMHLAMHDALNAIVPVYERYAYTGPAAIAHPVAAAAQAAHDVLVALYPDRQATIASQLALWLDRVPAGVFRERGIALGQATAAAMLTMRADDGASVQGTYEFRQGPGEYQTTPPWNGFVAQPGFRFARPFVRVAGRHGDAAARDVDAWHVAPPPPLTSRAYARAYNEVKEYGAIDSMRRTAEQTGYAVWWMEFAEGSITRLARHLVVDRGTDLWTAARLFAHVGVALFDTYVSVWESKYGFNRWRPYTAIRAADTDGNPQTAPDPGWESLRPATPIPEYVSAHAASCAATFGVLARVFGDDVPFTMATATAPPGMPTRTFASFRAAAAECADSRVRLGFHFRYATEAGLALGRHIAKRTVGHSLRSRARGN